MVNNEKCAPSIKNDGISCFSLEQLQQIATRHNNNGGNINITTDKKSLVKELEKSLGSKCNSHSCWLRLDILKGMDEKTRENTFVPTGPANNYDWLSNFDIQNVLKQYQSKYKDFMFLGALPIDFNDLPSLGIRDLNFSELEKNGYHKIGVIFNTDPHTKGGEHWISLFSDLEKGKLYYSDSVGKKPKPEIQQFINRIAKYIYKKNTGKKLNVNKVLDDAHNNKYTNRITDLQNHVDIRYNKNQHQDGDNACGIYSINFILRNLKGESFDDISGNIIKDNKMNSCRKVYFRKN